MCVSLYSNAFLSFFILQLNWIYLLIVWRARFQVSFGCFRNWVSLV
jgi:hypothetical protein